MKKKKRIMWQTRLDNKGGFKINDKGEKSK